MSYDIREARRLHQALTIIRQFATGGQKSVHECWLTRAEKQKQLASLFKAMDLSEDSLLVVPLRSDVQVVTFGRARAPVRPGLFYFG